MKISDYDVRLTIHFVVDVYVRRFNNGELSEHDKMVHYNLARGKLSGIELLIQNSKALTEIVTDAKLQLLKLKPLIKSRKT
jgi:hypothetical protein